MMLSSRFSWPARLAYCGYAQAIETRMAHALSRRYGFLKPDQFDESDYAQIWLVVQVVSETTGTPYRRLVRDKDRQGNAAAQTVV